MRSISRQAMRARTASVSGAAAVAQALCSLCIADLMLHVQKEWVFSMLHSCNEHAKVRASQ